MQPNDFQQAVIKPKMSKLKGFQECAMQMINTEKNISKDAEDVSVFIYHMYKYNMPRMPLSLTSAYLCRPLVHISEASSRTSNGNDLSWR